MSASAKPALDELREAVRQVTDYSTGWGRLKEAALRVLSEPPRQLTATREFLEALEGFVDTWSDVEPIAKCWTNPVFVRLRAVGNRLLAAPPPTEAADQSAELCLSKELNAEQAKRIAELEAEKKQLLERIRHGSHCNARQGDRIRELVKNVSALEGAVSNWRDLAERRCERLSELELERATDKASLREHCEDADRFQSRIAELEEQLEARPRAMTEAESEWCHVPELFKALQDYCSKSHGITLKESSRPSSSGDLLGMPGASPYAQLCKGDVVRAVPSVDAFHSIGHECGHLLAMRKHGNAEGLKNESKVWCEQAAFLEGFALHLAAERRPAPPPRTLADVERDIAAEPLTVGSLDRYQRLFDERRRLMDGDAE